MRSVVWPEPCFAEHVVPCFFEGKTVSCLFTRYRTVAVFLYYGRGGFGGRAIRYKNYRVYSCNAGVTKNNVYISTACPYLDRPDGTSGSVQDVRNGKGKGLDRGFKFFAIIGKHLVTTLHTADWGGNDGTAAISKAVTGF